MFSSKVLKWTACLVPLMCTPAVAQNALDAALLRSNDVMLRGMRSDARMVGYSKNSRGAFEAVQWTGGVGFPLGKLAGEIESKAFGMSFDGKATVGYSKSVESSSTLQYATIWDQSGDITRINYSSVTHTEASALAISADGSTVVGYSGTSTQKNAFYYTSVLGMTELTKLNASFQSQALSISRNGTAIAGYSETSASVEKAVIWTGGSFGSIVQLETTTYASSRAYAVSSNGNVVVGTGTTSLGVLSAFKYTGGTMTPIAMPTGATDSEARDVSGDGDVAVGYYDDADGNSMAYRQSDADGVMDMGTLSGGSSSMATSISEDGSTIMGVSNTENADEFRPFVFRSMMQDMMNLMESVEDVADGSSKAVDRNNRLARRLREEDCVVQAGSESCVGIRGLASSLLEGTNAFGGNIMGAHQFTDDLRAGLAVGLYGESSLNESISPNYGVGVGGYINYRLGQFNFAQFKSALNVRVDGAWFYTDADIERGAGFSDVQAMRNDTAFNSGAAGVRFEADTILNRTVLLKPYAGAYWQITARDGYSEDESGDTTATFDTLSANAVAAVLGLNADIALTDTLLLRIGVGAEVDFYSDGITVSGTSDIPGMEAFSFDGADNHNWVRGNLLAGIAYDMGNLGLVSLEGQVFTPRYETKLGGDVSVQYSLSF